MAGHRSAAIAAWPASMYPHFRPREFACPHCGVVLVTRELLEHLELLRGIVRKPIRIVSGYRCVEHNRRVGGVPRSQHLLGKAADIPAGTASVTQAKRAGFSGVGVSGLSAVHVDVRDAAYSQWSY